MAFQTFGPANQIVKKSTYQPKSRRAVEATWAGHELRTTPATTSVPNTAPAAKNCFQTRSAHEPRTPARRRIGSLLLFPLRPACHEICLLWRRRRARIPPGYARIHEIRKAHEQTMRTDTAKPHRERADKFPAI